MQRKDALKLSELLPQVLAEQHLDRRLDETQAALLWREIFGESVAAIRQRCMSGPRCSM